MNHGPRSRQRGFTLVETLVVTGLLAGFLVFLVQLLNSGIGLFQEGDEGQELSDRAHAASEAVRTTLAAMAGPTGDGASGDSQGVRLLVTRAPLGFDPAKGDVQVLRSTVHVDPREEEALAERAKRERGPAGRAEEEDALEAATRRGLGTLLFLPWPAGDAEGAYLELRRGVFLQGEGVPLRDGGSMEVIDLQPLDGETFPPALVQARTRPVATGLLHVEMAFWSQFTRDWQSTSPGSGPESVWDSARAGLFLGEKDDARRFALDIGPQAKDDPALHVWPRWIRVTVVVDRGPGAIAPGILAEEVGPASTTLRVRNDRDLPDPEEVQYLKLGGEWIRCTQRDGPILRGVQRGLRGTKAATHAVGTRLRYGRTQVFYLRVPHGKDSWNG